MQQRRLLAIVAGMALVSLTGAMACAQNQAPFTIRYPPDGATVRENVRIRVPLASIPEGGYVAFSIDGQFRVALAPSDQQRRSAARGAMFEYVWDTKAPMKVGRTQQEAPPADGEHTISATLYAPRATGAGGGAVAVQTSSVKVTLANKINAPNQGPISLRYNFIDGSNRTYSRTGSTAVVAGLTQGMQGTGDQELVSQRSALLVAVEDKYGTARAIVRNKLTKLTVIANGQETTYPETMLPTSLYQEVDRRGQVLYQNDTQSFDEFAALGLPISATLDLPVLPEQSVKVGDTWETSNVSLDIPGTAPDKQPKETVKSTLESIEWEGGYPTAKIHQHFEGATKAQSVIFGTTEITSPTVKFDRDIYLAYRTGVLVKMTRKLEITGKTAEMSGVVGGAPGGMAPGGPPPGAIPGGNPYGGMYGAASGMAGPTQQITLKSSMTTELGGTQTASLQ